MRRIMPIICGRFGESVARRWNCRIQFLRLYFVHGTIDRIRVETLESSTCYVLEHIVKGRSPLDPTQLSAVEHRVDFDGLE